MDHSHSRQLALPWQERPSRELLRLAAPTVVSLVSLSVMNLVDTLFIGWLGPVPLAAAGLGGICVFTALSFGLAVLGAAKVKVGERHGEGDVASVNRSLGAFLRLAVVLAAGSIIVGLAIAALLPALSADQASGRLAGQYLAIRSLAFPFVMVATGIAQWLQAQGDSKSGMRAALIANATNLPLNALLLFGLGWGVHGAAIATVCARVVEAGWLVRQQVTVPVCLPGGRTTQVGLHLRRASWRDAWDALEVGFPSGVERVLDMMAFASVPLLLSRLGPLHVAAHQIVLQIMLLSFLPLIALSESVSVLVSQAVGSHNIQLVRGLSRRGLEIALIYAALCALVCVLGSRLLVGVFTTDPSLVELASVTLLFGAALQFINAAYNHVKGVLRGLSVFHFVAWVTVGCAWLVTPPLTYFFGVVLEEGAPGAWKVFCVEVSLGLGLLIWRLGRVPALARRRME